LPQKKKEIKKMEQKNEMENCKNALNGYDYNGIAGCLCALKDCPYVLNEMPNKICCPVGQINQFKEV
jgi:hypothetical protein